MKTHTYTLPITKLAYTNYLASDFWTIERKDLLQRLINHSTKLSTCCIDMFDVKDYTMSAQHYISGYVEERFLVPLNDTLKSQLLTQLLLDYETFSEDGLYSWELYSNDVLMIGCNFVEDIITIHAGFII